MLQYNLGFMYYYGWRVSQDYKAALKWHRLSAQQGSAASQTDLGIMYQNAQGVAQDYKLAVKWYRLAAAQGDSYAQNLLGAMFRDGNGVIQDNIKAHMWFGIGASKGDHVSVIMRVKIEVKMTPAGIKTAQALAQKCRQSNYKQCD